MAHPATPFCQFSRPYYPEVMPPESTAGGPVKDVAIGLVMRDGKLLISRRRKDADLAGSWEFPGGKCEPGENPEQCCIRELKEEVGIGVTTTHRFSTIQFTYPHATVRLHPFLCRYESGDPAPLASDELRWVPPEELRQHALPKANDSLLVELFEYLDRTGIGRPH